MTIELRRLLRAAFLTLSVLGVAWLVALGIFAVHVRWFERLPAALAGPGSELALRDARKGLLREAPGDDGRRAEWVPLAQVPQAARSALIASEDHRLYEHFGVDALGLLRAAWLDLGSARTRYGGSTLAMQLARMSFGLRHDFTGKLEQALRGWALQARLGPDGVLEAWFNLAPFGRDLRGIAEASRVYVGKPLADLTRGEAIALALLPRAPTAYDPYLHRGRLLRRRAHVLAVLEQRGVISKVERSELAAEPLSLRPFTRPFRAPHASELARSEAERRGAADATALRTTLDPGLQRAAEWACERVVAGLRQQAATGCAAVVLRVSSAEVLALVGSPDFHGAPAGQVNAALMPRQPGSALKPFVYAIAFEQGLTPESRIVDEPTAFAASFGSWLPENYDRRFHGEVSLREALACSYNVPAAKLASSLGSARVLTRLRELGLSTLRDDAAHYGVGIALGVGEVSLLELTAAYATLSRGGEYLEPSVLASAERAGHELTLTPRRRARVFTPEASAQVSDVLSDNKARLPAFGQNNVLELPFRAAVKTGTSSNYRDNWTLGYAGDFAVGVWVGRHDGAPMHGVSGVSGAGPAFRHLMLSAEGKHAAERTLASAR